MLFRSLLTESEQIKGEVFKPTERIKVYILEVKSTSKGPKILVSRTHPELVKRLFESEVTEVKEGIVEIKAISREARGIITAGHRGGGHKRLYRKIDFRRNEKDIYGRIVTIEYDPNRNAYICLIHYGDGEKRYILHPRGAIIGDTIVSGTEVPIKMGNALPLSAV